MTYDRTYWRSESTQRLIETARDSGDELTIALGERLEDLADMPVEVEELREELRAAENLIEYLRKELRETEQALQTAYDAIEG